MNAEQLTISANPKLKKARMVLGFSGWMDGGDVSTGTVDHLVEELGAQEIAEIAPTEFYMYSFPGSMEVTSLFRPHTRIKDGRIEVYQPPRNVFYAAEEANLVFFHGREPSLHWEEFADCVFSLVATFDIQSLYFVGSVGGLVPHTREPRLFSSFSDARLRSAVEAIGARPTDYEGPASIVTLLTKRAAQEDIPMATVVAEIPAYIQGRNPRCIESMLRKLGALLGLPIHLDDLRKTSDAFERRVNEMVEKRAELAALIEKLESDYDNEVFDTQMGDLKDWLEGQGLRPE